MLTLTLKQGEKVQIGDEIVVMITDIDRNKIRIGIQAPRNISIFRQELLALLETPPVKGSNETPN